MAVSFDDGLSTIIDSTTDPLYTYIYKAISPTASISGPVWLCKRVVNATGTARFANGISDFSVSSSLMTVVDALTASYTAG